MKEFSLIEKYFSHHKTQRNDVILGIGDDCAILRPPANQELVVTTDSLIESIHFLRNTSAADIGYKALAVSLSDIAAMGAEPAWVLLSLTLPEANEKWLQEFCDGFYNLLDKFSLVLVGGNTTQGPLNITTQVTGFVSPGKALRRSGAKPGDLIYVTGTLGDAGLALQVLQKQRKLDKESLSELLPRLYRPQPRVNEGVVLQQLASAAIDISDGLAADLSHLLNASKVGATIKTARLPLSKILRTQIKPEQAWQLALTAGDDYELCFTVPPALQGTFEVMFGSFDCGYICIGKIEEQPGLRILDPQEKPFHIGNFGYEHFSA
jgi:thiamine-monophosphate kinase